MMMDPVKTREILERWVTGYMETYPERIGSEEEYREQYPQDEKTLAEVFGEWMRMKVEG